MATKLINLFSRKDIVISILIVLIALVALYSFKFLFSLPYFPKIFFACFCWFIVFNVISLQGSKLSSWRRIFFGILLASLLTTLWLIYPHWLINNIIVFFILTNILVGFPSMKLKTMIIICIGFFFYDMIAVFYLDVMVNVANLALENNLPLLLIIPKSLSISEENRLIAIGLGDIVVPALLIRTEIHRARKYLMPKMFDIPMMSLVLSAGYVIGLTFALLIFWYFKKSQPALVYIIPTMLSVLFIAYLKKGLIKI